MCEYHSISALGRYTLLELKNEIRMEEEMFSSNRRRYIMLKEETWHPISCILRNISNNRQHG